MNGKSIVNIIKQCFFFSLIDLEMNPYYKLVDKIKNKFGLEEYLLDIIINNKKEIKDTIENKKMYSIDSLDLKADNLKDFLSNKTNDEILQEMLKNVLNK